ncbi:leucine-rich repeat-containing protein kinase family protein [Luteolibacter marinus]|uniref:leucine-rich repeat-containing protein kinase family protein n=1 Tax=Luteolibacter marinus TaxID=2776705 RepID=UPI0018679BD4|nr:leucine-rich repeat-containing protein kinase family protein [Luteolibacter marinus]
MDTLSQLRAGKLAGVRRLDLCDGLTEFPREIFDLADSLEILNLSGNRLSSLPDDLPRLARLRILFCSQNEFRHVPPVLGECGNLSMLAFKSNAIESVAEGALPPSLRWLILTDNRIPRLPASIGNCRPLQKLMLAGNRLEALPDEMAACENLELIRLAANRFRSLPGWLWKLPRLSWFAFAGNPVAGRSRDAGGETIDWHELELEGKLGEGASGVIHGARWRQQPVAVKLFKGAMTSDGLPECEMDACLAAGSHLNLIRVLGRITGHPGSAAGLVMTRIDGGFTSLAEPPSFETCTRDVYSEGMQLSPERLLRMARGLASAAAELHAKGIMHGDLYGHNVLWHPEGDCLLGDFGAATFHPENGAIPAGALEQLEVRAFGCLLEELADRCSGAVPAGLRRLQVQCLAASPAERPRFAEILAQLQTSNNDVTD